MLWKDAAQHFEIDGSLRDIIISGTTTSDWDKLISLSAEFGRVSYERDGISAELPASASRLLNDKEHAHVFKVDLCGPVANTHFFIEDEIEFDIDPREIRSQATLHNVLSFCSKLSRALKRDVKITEENTPEAILLYYRYAEQVWRMPTLS
ncbi:hypothetical protein PsAD46_03410 [Pseudovibrio sp. Ad46]|uniref:hypothetical protein n=1 Tax=unclassified Pseudovibrio TaxID=2627060 RepID=UPI0007AE8899|nr:MULTISPECIES: hypothetical protein [unclassified Pseudovibrio]KZK84855.1 hypothetical protein PsAD46_03410 [Pseudovibrio sp. Ad46]KZK92519.1 hypothetical protein PsW74_05446 [Pseudovibrio sp. W74]KZK98968.1 hypothetical protein PsAD5_01591 [Pseudovibrio sp. Ad5]KZL10769.1 hypothetical protein PsAD14_01241 [Pseudovibrio sp. Ad14]